MHIKRHLGTFGGTPGPTVICVGGIHGNEPSGVLALERVFRELNRTLPAFNGELVGLGGNLTALRQQARFLSRDLNRVWTAQNMRALHNGDPIDPEHQEQRELMAAFEEAAGRAMGPIYFLDLHTTSADSAPFVCIGDTMRNRAFAMNFPVPIIMGLEEQIDGAMLECINNRGITTLGFEAGQHDSPSSVDRHEAAVWIALIAAGCVEPRAAPGLASLRRTLIEASAGLPRILEVRHRHAITPEDDFVMEPGFKNLAPIDQNQLLARDRRGEIRAEEAARILLPLYQGKGDDGFFVARPMEPLWLKLSAALRRLRVDSLARLLPWLRPVPGDPDTLIPSPGLPMGPLTDVMNLLGYRKIRQHPGHVTFTRRRNQRR